MSNGLVIFLYIIMAYGFSNMMVYGSGPFRIFEHIRNTSNNISEHFGSMFSCMMCFPANIGWIISVIDWFLLPSIAISVKTHPARGSHRRMSKRRSATLTRSRTSRTLTRLAGSTFRRPRT